MSGHKVSRVHVEFIKRVSFGCVERLGQRPELDFKLPAGGSVPVLFSSLEHSDFDGSCAQRTGPACGFYSFLRVNAN